MSSKYDPAIDKGIALLDAKVPEWCAKMQLAHLDLALGRSCVLGQVFGSYYDGLKALGVRNWGEDEGFFVLMKDGAFSGLTRRWKQRIRQHCEAHDEVRRAGES